MKQIPIFLIMLFIPLVGISQHIIYFSKPTGLQASVKSITFTKKSLLLVDFLKPDNPPQEVDKANIIKIVFSDGSIMNSADIVTKTSGQSNTATNSQTSNLVNSTQRDTNCYIWDCKVLKKGFYKSYEEYLHNSPSVIRNFRVVHKSAFSSISGLGGGSGDFKYILEEGEQKVGRFWGLCDGEKVFVGPNVLQSKQLFWALDFIGKNPSFTYIYHAGLLTTVINAATDGIDMFINDEGKLEKATVENLQKLFSSQPDFLKRFNSDPNQRSKRKEYIHTFNDNLKNSSH